MKGYNLFDDQAEFVGNIRASLRSGYRSILGVASPAFGKTVVAGHIIGEARKKTDATAWFLVHRKNLLRQTSKSFWAAHIEHGLITSGKSKSNLPVQVGTIGSVYSRRDTLTPPTILFIDEAHLSKGNMFETVINWCKAHGSIVIGLTGTPERLDGKALGDIFDTMVEARSTSWLIEQGRLSDYVMYSSRIGPNLDGLKKSAGDYNREQLAEVMDDGVLVGDAVSHWQKYANGLRTVAYCVNVKHSKHTAQAFNDSGIPAIHVDAETTEKELTQACEGLASGKYLVLCNCELVIEGFDLSAQVGKDITIECCILLRPTQSVSRYLQMIFRALRKKDAPAIVLDHAGCASKHGLPDDEREWSLKGKKRRKKKDADEEPDVTIQSCNSCFFIFKPGPGKCPKCGEPVKKMPPREIRQIDGELERIDVTALRKQAKQEQGQSRGLSDLIELGQRRGMKNATGWAVNVFCARKGRKPSPSDYQEAKQIARGLTR